MAYRCDSLEQLKELRKQIKIMGTPVSKIWDHGFIYSIYFDDPNGFHLECTCTRRGYTTDEFQPAVLDRQLKEGENDWVGPTPGGVVSDSESAKLFERIEEGVIADPSLVKKVKGVICFKLTKPDSE